MEQKEENSQLTKKKTIIGIFIILGLVILQLANNIFGQALMKNDEIPSLFLVYFNASFNIVGFLIAKCLSVIEKNQGVQKIQNYTHKQLFKIGIYLLMMYQLGNWIYFLGLNNIPLAFSQIIYQTSTIWVFILSALFLREQLQPYKFMAVVFVFFGVILVEMDNNQDSMGEHNYFLNVVALLISAFLWASYEVSIAIFLPGANSKEINNFIGYRGVANIILLTPIMLIIYLANPQYFDFLQDLTENGRLGLFFMAFVSVLITILIALGITYTNPIFIGIGATLNTPASILYQLLLKQPIGLLTYVGCLMTIFGFIFINLRWKSKRCSYYTQQKLRDKFFGCYFSKEERGLEEEESTIQIELIQN